ncbi:MAG: FAD-dependent oxidoreductase [Burkholderiales bacterium]|jgi:NADPH-dependent glutamate synthase beta subunit-like oxidoreductase|nr:FAD-dependent oxidoreductase [Burkholderiales bacterium]
MNAPLPVPPTWTTGTTEGIHTGTWRAATPRHIAAPSPCRQACPVGGEIATWIGQARSGDLHGAWLTLVRNNPFPSIAGRICHHPCEAACNRGGYDEALSICRLERHVGDQALAQGWALPAPQPQTQLGAGPETRAAHAARATHVAVVGGGPAGLSAAYQLRRRGHRVSLYEASTELGGVMRHGIPAYRLSRRVLDAEIARIVALGVELHCGQALSGTDALDALARTHDAVFVALGAQQPKALAQIDGAPAWFMDGAGYLAACSRGAPPALGRRVVVVGGGSAAIDVARSARRAGHAVTLLALERRPQMPAQRDEVDEALEEGITLVDGAQLGSVHEAPEGTVDAALTLQCRRVDFVPGAERGRFELRPIDAGDFTLAADAVLAAIGQDARLDDLGPALQRRGALLWTDDAGQTSDARVWAGGDLASMARFVTEAVGMGARAARAIDARLRERAGLAPLGDVGSAEPVVPLSAISLHYHPARARAASPRRPAAERVADQAEVQLGLDAAQALAEAKRCFSCGHCIHCDQCVTYCPDLAVQRVDAVLGGYRVNTDYCKGCGVCVRECPTGSMAMSEDTK